MPEAPRHSPHALLGTTLSDGIKLTAVIGKGAMGTVFRGIDLEHGDAPVAVKVIHPELLQDAEVVERFEREIEATAAIRDPHSVEVIAHGRAEGGGLYLVMELLEGRTLQDRIDEQGAQPSDTVVAVGAQIARALQAAHTAGVIHRDLKPSNVFVRDDDGAVHAKVFDFGLSLVGIVDESDTRLTATGLRIGTPAFMAPEYIADGQMDPRCDLYALGVILYELATGMAPFTGRSYEILNHHLNTPVPPVSKVAPGAHPRWLRSVIERLLAKDAAARFQTAEAVASALLNPDTSVPATPIPDADDTTDLEEAAAPSSAAEVPAEVEPSAPAPARPLPPAALVAGAVLVFALGMGLAWAWLS